MVTVIKNGTLVTASDTYQANLWIDGDKIVSHSHPSQPIPSGSDIRVVDATGCYVIPGGIDAHTHL